MVQTDGGYTQSAGTTFSTLKVRSYKITKGPNISASNDSMMAVNVEILGGVTLSSRIMAGSYSSGDAHETYQMGVLEGGHARPFYCGAHHSILNELIVFDSDEPYAGHLLGHTGWLRRAFLDLEPSAPQRITSAVVDKPVPGLSFPNLSTPNLFKLFATLYAEVRRGVFALEAEARTV